MNYLEKLSNCFPDAQAYVLGNNDPNIYANLIWLTTAIPQATLDSDVCPVQATDIQGGQNIFQSTFIYKGNIENKWIGLESSLTSDETPYIVPWNATIVGIGFSNTNNDADIDIEIYKSLNGSDNINTLLYQWDIRTARTGYKTDVNSGLTFNAGDKMGIFLKKFSGNKPQNVQLVVYFQIDENTTIGESVESYSGNF